MERAQVLSFGGGVQSVAMCLLVARGVLPRPDWIVCADTGREAQSTWDYLDGYLRPFLAEFGLIVHVAPHSLATVDLYAQNGDLLLPVYTATGKFRTYCSNEWKAWVNQRWLRERGVTSADQWIGFTLEERRRVKAERPGPWRRVYPLLDHLLTRSDCEQVIRDRGLPLPAKSACFMCPHRTNEEWRFIRDTYPDQWKEAIRIDEEIREADDRGAVYLHQSRVPLAEADLDVRDRREPDRQCGLGNCFL